MRRLLQPRLMGYVVAAGTAYGATYVYARWQGEPQGVAVALGVAALVWLLVVLWLVR